jgi:hypothetical protein
LFAVSEHTIENVCLYCENRVIGADDPSALRADQARVCKIHLAQIMGPAPAGMVFPVMPATMHPDGRCEHGGRCRV